MPADWRKIERELHHLFAEQIVVEHLADTTCHEYRQNAYPDMEAGQEGGDQYFSVVLQRDSNLSPINSVRIDLTALARRLSEIL